MRSAAAIVVALAIVLLVGAPCVVAPPVVAAPPKAEPALKAGTFTPAREAPNFVLRGSNGAALELARYRGQAVLLVFGFTACPAVCPATLATLAQARRKLGPAAARLQVLYVTVDPERDSVEVMRAYLAAFDDSFIGGTGSADQLAKVRAAYGVSATRVSVGDGYAMDHSTSVALIDPAGRLRGVMPYGRKAEDYVHDLKLLLGE